MAELVCHPFTHGVLLDADDVDLCSAYGCDQPWDNPVHAPSGYLRDQLKFALPARDLDASWANPGAETKPPTTGYKPCRDYVDHTQHLWRPDPDDSSEWAKCPGMSVPEGDSPALSNQIGVPQAPSFHAWWVAMADREAPTVQRKAEEYGTNSLVEMGRVFARAQGRDVSELEAIEIGCFLYAYGKIQRVSDALLKGKLPNIDSWHDVTIYSLMVQFSREVGGWPGV